MIQQVKDKTWYDESGSSVPIDYVPQSARLRERYSAKILNDAKRINKNLESFKKDVERLCDEVFTKTMQELNSRTDYKGNFTWFNFDRSIKIEVSIANRITFDDLTIQACKDKLDEFLGNNLDSKTEFVKDLVADAFSTSKGKLDAKKVMSLLKYRSKITDPLFQEALSNLSDSIRRPDSKKYFRVWRLGDRNQYELVDLNFSSI